jgi:ATP-binding cassette subfamily F protein uup
MRAKQSSMRAALNERLNTADLTAEVGASMSKKVIEAKGLSKTFDTPNGPLVIAEDLSIKILRGDRIGIIGPNGAGKTTLVKLLLGQLEPDSGHLRHAKTLDVTYLDQTRDTLTPTDTLWEAMAPEGGDSIMVQGKQRHIAAYAKDFLFKPAQLRQPVGALSGGERNRLSLAIGLAKPANLMVLDEPTNDLDMQTLDLLEDMLLAFEGTLLLVSHDRAFLDSTVTSCLCPVGEGKWIQTAGGWSDAQIQLKGHLGQSGDGAAAKVKSAAKSSSAPKTKTKLSYKDEHRQKELDALILALPKEIAGLEADLADPDLYARDPGAFTAKSTRIGAAREELSKAEEDWLVIEEMREALQD